MYLDAYLWSSKSRSGGGRMVDGDIEGEERGKRVRMDVGERTQAKSTRGRQMLSTHTN